MSRAEKASEPSMEEILASIRKIISEDPAGAPLGAPAAQPAFKAPAAAIPLASATAARAASPQAEPAPGLLSSLGQPSQGQPSQGQSSSSRPAAAVTNNPSAAASLDDILGMADEPAQPSPKEAWPKELSPKEPLTKQPPLAQSSPVSPPQTRAGQSATVPPSPARGTENRPIPGAAERPQVQPFFPPQSRDTVPVSNSLPASAAPSASGSDFGAVVPGRADAVRQPDSPVGTPRFGELRPDGPFAERINGGNYGAPAQRTQPAAPSPSPGLNGTGLNGIRAYQPAPLATPPEALVEKAPPAAAAPAAPSPAMETRAAVVASPAIDATSDSLPKPAAAIKPQSQTQDPPKSEAQMPAGATATNATPFAAGAAAPASIIPASIIPASASLASAPTVALEAKPVAAAAPQGAVAPDPAPMAAVSAPAVLPPTAGQGEPTRTMEDTVAELLRPMLRQWLDTNMPRVVEKALRVELAASAKPKTDPSKS